MDGRAVVRVAELVAAAEVVVVTAGAGMGVDSGLPDFRGDRGFWRAYPPYERLGWSFFDLAEPSTFDRDPEIAWGFYGHRRALYRRTVPHDGFGVVRDVLAGAPAAGLVFTSNVDGQFQRAGLEEERVTECHGSLLWDQCLAGCGQELWPAAADEVTVDPSTMRATGRLPTCPACGGLARPNVLMFGDGAWDPARTEAQHARLERRLREVEDRSHVIVEVGAGTTVPTVRWFGARLSAARRAPLVRINPDDVEGADVAIRAGAARALTAIAAALERG